jgi:ubiquinone/menaquinone biosynthesis C-methylase UbiE
MNTPTEAEATKQMVREKYSQIAAQTKEQNAASCCGAGGCSTVDYTIFSEDYSAMKGYVEGADLALGCGIPTEFAQIKEGDTVVDLGSGAGNDAFVARALVGEHGKVIGIDMTPAMIDKARDNADALGFNNVEFRLGEIEHIPITANRADVVVSNCVLNLVPDKRSAFAEMFRILKPGGHFSVSDVVLRGELPEALKHDAEMYAGCVSGAIQQAEYLRLLQEVGFENVQVQKEKPIVLPEDVLRQYLQQDEIDRMHANRDGICSITVYGKKPLIYCDPNSGCC